MLYPDQGNVRYNYLLGKGSAKRNENQVPTQEERLKHPFISVADRMPEIEKMNEPKN